MEPKFLEKDKRAMERLYSQVQREIPEEVFKGRLAIEEFVLDFSLQKEKIGFLLDKKFDWCIVYVDTKLLLVPLKKEEYGKERYRS